MGTCNDCTHCDKNVELAGEMYDLCWYSTNCEHVKNLNNTCFGWSPVIDPVPRKTRPLSRGVGCLKVRY